MLYAIITILGKKLTLLMGLLDKTWPEKSNGIGFKLIGHTMCTLEPCMVLVYTSYVAWPCEYRLRTFWSHCIARGTLWLEFIIKLKNHLEKE
jgi:hypothetical protein